MGRMECYKKDAYHVRKYSRPTPRLAHVTVGVSQGFLSSFAFPKIIESFPCFVGIHDMFSK